MITVSKLNFSYAHKNVLNGCDFRIGEGDFCAIIGPNGSGKTTLLKLIAGLMSPQSGRILLASKDIAKMSVSERARTIAYVSQRQDVVFDFSVFDTILMGRNPYQGRWSEASAHDIEVVERVLEQTHLTDLRHRMLTELSGGEVQRVMIARAMAQETPLILLDEPLSNLDVAYEFQVMDILQQLNKQQHTTIVIVLHDFAFVNEYAHHTLLLKNGQIQSFGPTEEALSAPNIRQAFDLSECFDLDTRGNVFRIDNH